MVAFATQVKRRRGTEAQNNEFTGAEGEITVDLTNMTLRVHDGVTQGGFEMARQADLDNKADTSYIDGLLATKADTDLGNIPTNYDYVVESQLPTADNGYTWYRKYKSGWVEQGGSFSSTVTNSFNTITMPVAMRDTNYCVFSSNLTNYEAGTGSSHAYVMEKAASIYNLTTTTIGVFSQNKDRDFIWQVSGMSA